MLDVVIVGAGAAGVGAARHLDGLGLNLLVVEADAAPGGRARTRLAEGLPLDLGCGWLHSADRNPWASIAEELGIPIDRRTPAWGRQHRDLGFPPDQQAEARKALNDWIDRVAAAPSGDNAADVLPADSTWVPYIHAMAGFISGVDPSRISAADFTSYDQASTGSNWRAPGGYGNLVATAMPSAVEQCFNTPVSRISTDRSGVSLHTDRGTIRARAAVLTVSTAVLAGGAIDLPGGCDPWRHAAHLLPLGRDEKLFLTMEDGSPFEDETQLLADPNDADTGAYYIRPFGWPVIECFYGGDHSAALVKDGGLEGFARATDELASLLGSSVRRLIRPLIASDWSHRPHIGGAYSCALPGSAAARLELGMPYEDRLFFAGEATSPTDFSTAHGAYQTGVRAAEEALTALGRGRSAARRAYE